MSEVFKDCGFYSIGDSTFSVSLSPYKASLARVMVPDRNGKIENVTTALESASSYVGAGGGGIIMCPNAGRIMSGKLPIGGKTYWLALTNDALQMHGGPNAVNKWDVEEYDENHVRFVAEQPDGLDGWPGNRKFWVTYCIDVEKKMFRLTMEAVSDKPTYVNMGSHAYWNMSGDFSKPATDQILTLRCSRAWMNDEYNVAKECVDVTGGPYDYRMGAKISDYLEKFADHPELSTRGGYDNAFVLDHDDDTQPDIQFYDPKSGRRLCIKTDAPAVVIFSGGRRKPEKGTESMRQQAKMEAMRAQFAGRRRVQRGGVEPAQSAAIAFECHDIPNTPNMDGVEGIKYRILQPGEMWVRNVDYYFDIV